MTNFINDLQTFPGLILFFLLLDSSAISWIFIFIYSK